MALKREETKAACLSCTGVLSILVAAMSLAMTWSYCCRTLKATAGVKALVSSSSLPMSSSMAARSALPMCDLL